MLIRNSVIMVTSETAPHGSAAALQDSARLSAIVCETGKAYIAIRQNGAVTVRACVGIDAIQVFAPSAFHIAEASGALPLILEDISTDSRFADIPITIGPPAAKFCAVAPIFGDNDTLVGVLCVFDYEARKLNSDQIIGLQLVSSVASNIVNQMKERHSQRDPAETSTNGGEELEFQISRDRFRLMVENEADVTTILAEDGTIRYCSPSVTTVLGYKPEELVGKSTFNFIHPDDVSRRFDALSTTTGDTDLNPPIIFRFRHKDTSWRHIESVARRMTGEPAINGILVSSRDITNRRHDQGLLELMQSVVVNARDGVLITAAESIDDPEPRIVYANPALMRMSGYSDDELVGRSPRVLQGSETSRQELNRIREALLKWSPVRSELVNYTKTGEEYNVEVDIFPLTDDRGWYTHWVSIQRELSGRNQTLAYLEQLCRHNKCFLWIGKARETDEGQVILEQHMLLPNVAAELLNLEAVAGQPFSDTFRNNILASSDDHIADLPADKLIAGEEFHRILEVAQNSGEPIRVLETICMTLTNEKEWELMGICEIRDQHLGALQIGESESAIAARLELEDLVHLLTETVEEPLSTATRLLDKSNLNSDEMAAVRSNVDSAHSLVMTLLDYTRVKVSDLEFEPVQLSAAAEVASSQLEMELKSAGVRITINPLPTVDADPVQMVQLFKLLFVSAMKRNAPARIDIFVSGFALHGMVSVRVADNGTELDEEAGQNLFTVNHALEDAGIGLAVCKRIVERHDGQIRFLSGDESGSILEFVVPIHAKKDE
ncbi:MAG: PAS domain-containing protein [Chthonomonadales bacterium]